MNRVSKGIACALVLGVAAFGLTGCGTQTTSPEATTTGSGSTQTAPQTTTTATPDASESNNKQTIQVADEVGDGMLAEQLRAYINHAESMDGVTSITITKVDVVEKDNNKNIVAKAKIDAKLSGATKSSFKDGTNERYVLFNNAQGVWDVVKVSETQLKIAADAPQGTGDFAKEAQKVEATVVNVLSFPVTVEGTNKERDTLANLTLKIDKGGSFKAGEQVVVDFAQQLPDGSKMMPNKGDKVIVWVGPNDPRMAAGTKGWVGKLNGLCVQRDGKTFNMNGIVVSSTDLK
ncbi:MAG: hypothetical protein WCC10_16585 [Tumebacillaceae bacterium]